MKKLITILFIGILTLTGCNLKNNDDNNTNAVYDKEFGGYKKDTKYESYQEMNENILKALEEIEINEENLYLYSATLDDNSIETELGLTTKDFVNYVIKVPQYGLFDSTYCLIFKVEESHEERVKKMLDIYFDSKISYMENSITTEDDTYKNKVEILKNMKITQINGYTVYVSSPDNDLVINKLKDIIK